MSLSAEDQLKRASRALDAVKVNAETLIAEQNNLSVFMQTVIMLWEERPAAHLSSTFERQLDSQIQNC